jgi:hypothetical protein
MLVYFFQIKRIKQPLNVYSKLEEMLALRKLGWSYSALSERFDTPQNTIAYLCQRFNLGGSINPPIPKMRTTSKDSKVFHNERNEAINRGKTYSEYLQEERERKWQKLTQKQSTQ